RERLAARWTRPARYIVWSTKSTRVRVTQVQTNRSEHTKQQVDAGRHDRRRSRSAGPDAHHGKAAGPENQSHAADRELAPCPRAQVQVQCGRCDAQADPWLSTAVGQLAEH